MKYIFSLLAIILFSSIAFSQQPLYPPHYSKEMNLPEWVHLMMQENPNVWQVDKSYKDFYNENVFEKNNFTQYYKKWRKSIEPFIENDGTIKYPTVKQRLEKNIYLENLKKENKSANRSIWQCIGPFETVWEEDNEEASWQVNVYCMDVSLSNLDVLYAATEGGEIFKTIDKGLNWTCVSRNYNMNAGEAIRINPINNDIVYYGAGNNIYKTIDGGATWNIIYTLNGLNISSIAINPLNPQTILAAGNKGLFKSNNGGANWNQIYTTRVWDIQYKPLDTTIVYIAKSNTTNSICEFFKSTNGGNTFSIRLNGWYNSTDINREDGGCRLAVTIANPEYVYAHLIGQSKDGDNGFIGVYRSTDSGENWTLPHGQIGSPYNCTNASSLATCPFPNIVTIGATGTYHQGYYNSDIIASQTDANKILIGACSFWQSADGGATFTPVGGYTGDVPRIHPDIQDLCIIGNDTWLACDGGINYSVDFFQTHESRKNGISSSDFWGFDNGWNEDIMVGGRYHNGNTALSENYNQGVAVRLGGAESATGYLNPGNAQQAYFSDIGNLEIPNNINDAISWLNQSNFYPNESYYESEFSNMVFDPRCYNTVWLGSDNKIMKSTDGGNNYNTVYTFGSDPGDEIMNIEISREDERVMYCLQLQYSSNSSQLWRSINSGISWTACNMPIGYRRVATISLNPGNKNELWMAYRNANSGEKIYKTSDGGVTWINLSSSTINNEKVIALLAVANTNGGIYAGTYNTVFYRNNSMSDWQVYADGLPLSIMINRFKPSYRDSKIRMAAYGKGLWEAAWSENPSGPLCQPMVDKLTAYCVSDTFYFDDYSTLNHTGASWNWSFENGNPATSSIRNPKVVFNGVGVHVVTLTVTDGNGNSDTDTIQVRLNAFTQSIMQENFETVFFPNQWKYFTPDNGSPAWLQTNTAGGFGVSPQSMIFNNYDNDAQGKKDDVGFGLNLSSANFAKLKFDVAYAKWGNGYPDTLQVLASTDCGANFDLLYSKSLDVLATAPQNNSSKFIPTANQWRTDSLNLSAYLNESSVIIAFRCIGYYGQPIYIDNVNLSSNSNTGIEKVIRTNISVYPSITSIKDGFNINSNSNASIELYNAEGKILLIQNVAPGISHISLNQTLATGIYYYKIKSDKGLNNGKLIIK
jgi:photosystem II stability/assembly factor-like uncharacterized protein